MMRTVQLYAMWSALAIGSAVSVLAIAQLEVAAILSPILAVLTFSFLALCASPLPLTTQTSRVVARSLAREAILPLLLCVSIATIAGPYGYEPIWVPWQTLSVDQWARLIVAGIMVFLFPGYVILDAIDLDDHLVPEEKIVFAYIISLLTVSTLAYVVVLFNLEILKLALLLLAMNGTLLACRFALRLRHCRKAFVFKTAPKSIWVKVVLMSIIAFQIACMLIIFTLYFSETPHGDMWRHIGLLQTLSKPNAFDALSTWSKSAYWYQLNILAFKITSGLPLLNSYISTSFASPLLVMAFYALSRNALKDERESICATLVFSVFSGLGWIYYAYLRATNWPTSLLQLYSALATSGFLTMFDVWRSPILWDWAPIPMVQALICFVAFLTLCYNRRLRSLLWCTLATAFWSVGYLIHIHESIVLTLVVLPVLILFQESRLASVASIFGAMLVFGLDWLSPNKWYICQTPLLETLAISLTYSAVAIMGRQSIARLRFAFAKRFNKTVRTVIRPILLYLYGVATISLIMTFFQFDTKTAWMPFQSLPLPYLPIRFGLALPIVLIGLGSERIERESSVKFAVPLVAIAGLLTFGKLITGLNIFFFPTGYLEYRVVPLVWIFLALAAGVSLSFIGRRCAHAVSRGRLRKCTIYSILLTLIIVTGSLSTVLSVQWNALANGPSLSFGESISAEEREAIAFLLHVLPSANQSAVVAYTSLDAQKIGMAGINQVSRRDVFFRTNDPLLITYIISSNHVKYVYMTDENIRDLIVRNSNSFFARYMLPYLPVAFRNKQVMIFELPAMSGPSPGGIGLVTPSIVTPSLAFSVLMLSLSHANYDYLLEGSSLLDKNSILIPYDPKLHQTGWYDSSFQTWTTLRADLLTTDNAATVIANASPLYHDLVSPSISVDLDEYPYLITVWKTGSPEQILWIYPWSSSEGYRYIQLGGSANWATSIIDLRDYFPRHTVVQRVKYRLFVPNGNFSIKFIALKDAPTIHNSDPFRYIEWVSAAKRTLLVINIDGRKGFFADCIGDGQKPISLREAPHSMLTVGLCGNGTVVYADMSTVFTSLKSENETLKHTAFAQLRDVANRLAPLVPLQVDPSPIYPITFDGYKSMSGKIEINTSFLTLGEATPYQVKIDLHNAQYSAKNEGGLPVQVNSFKLSSVVSVGRVQFTIHALAMTSQGDGWGPHPLMLFPEGFSVTTRMLEDGARLFLYGSLNSTELALQVIGGEISLEFNQGGALFLERPTLQLAGTLHVARSYLGSPYNTIISTVFGSSLDLSGKVSLSVAQADSSTWFIDKLSMQDVKVTSHNTTIWNDWQLPWVKILMSPMNFALLFASLFIILVTFRFRIKIRISVAR